MCFLVAAVLAVKKTLRLSECPCLKRTVFVLPTPARMCLGWGSEAFSVSTQATACIFLAHVLSRKVTWLLSSWVGPSNMLVGKSLSTSVMSEGFPKQSTHTHTPFGGGFRPSVFWDPPTPKRQVEDGRIPVGKGCEEPKHEGIEHPTARNQEHPQEVVQTPSFALLASFLQQFR